MTPHLRGQVRAYVDRTLPPAILHVFDRHVVTCVTCRAAADQERRIIATLRADSAFVPGSLRSSLMGLAATAPLDSEPTRHPGPRIPLGPLASLTPGSRALSAGAALTPSLPVPTVAPTAPALHRSPMRAAVAASLAAGASVAAAWGLAVSPLPGSTRAPSARVPSGVASFGAVNYLPALPPSTPGRSATTRFGAGVAAAGTGAVAEGSGEAPVSTSGLGAVRSSRPIWVISSSGHRLMSTVPGPVRISLVSSAQSRP